MRLRDAGRFACRAPVLFMKNTPKRPSKLDHLAYLLLEVVSQRGSTPQAQSRQCATSSYHARHLNANDRIDSQAWRHEHYRSRHNSSGQQIHAERPR